MGRYIATNDDTWDSISRALGVTEQSLVQSNQGIGTVGGGMVFNQPWLPPRSWDVPAGPPGQRWWIENFLRALNSRTPYTPINWGGQGDTSLVNLNFAGAGQMLAPLGADNAGELYPTGKDVVNQFVKGVSVLAGKDVTSVADKNMLAQANRAMTMPSMNESSWRDRGFDPARIAALIGPKQISDADRAMLGYAGHQTEAIDHWRSVLEAVEANVDPPELRYSDLVGLAKRMGLKDVGAVEAFLKGGGYTKAGNTWISSEAQVEKPSGGLSWGSKEHGGEKYTAQQILDSKGLGLWRGYKDVYHQDIYDWSDPTLVRVRYDSFGQVQSYAPKVETKRSMGGGKPTKGQRNRYGGGLFEDTEYLEAKQAWKDAKNEKDDDDDTGTIGHAARPYNYLGGWNDYNYNQPQSSQVYRDMYDPLGNLNWKID